MCYPIAAFSTTLPLARSATVPTWARPASAPGRRWDRSGSARERAREALGQVGLGPLIDRPIRTLSGGETQRVVIARALCSLRPFILADEPTGQLDRRTTDGVLESLLTDTHGKGVVIVTHDPTVASRCDRTLYLADGVLMDHLDETVGS